MEYTRLDAIPHRNVADLVEAKLRHLIVSSNLRPGDKLPSENALASHLGVGRNAVREALRSLHGLGIVEARHGKGHFLKGLDFERLASGLAYSLVISRSSLGDLLHIRRALETAFLEEAIGRLGPSDVAKLEALVCQMHGKLRGMQTFVLEDCAFHRLLFKNLNNRPLLNFLEVFWLLFQEIEENTEHTPEQLREAVVYHERILVAVRDGDVASAQALLREHLLDAEERVRHA